MHCGLGLLHCWDLLLILLGLLADDFIAKRLLGGEYWGGGACILMQLLGLH